MKKISYICLSVLVLTCSFFTACEKDDSNPPSGNNNNPTPDTTPPVITIAGANPITVTLNTPFTDPGAVATDNIDGSVIVISDASATNPDVNLAGTYSIIYSASDSAGNLATAIRTVNVIITRANYIWSNYFCSDSSTTDSLMGPFFYSGNISAGSAADAIVISNFTGTLQNCVATVNGATVTIPSQVVGPFIVQGSGTMNNAGDSITIDYSDGTNNFHAVFEKQ